MTTSTLSRKLLCKCRRAIFPEFKALIQSAEQMVYDKWGIFSESKV